MYLLFCAFVCSNVLSLCQSLSNQIWALSPYWMNKQVIIKDWPCYVMSVNSTDALQDLCCWWCSSYSTADAVVLCLWTTSRPPSWLDHSSITELPPRECQRPDGLIPRPLPVAMREHMTNIPHIDSYLSAAVQITPERINRAAERLVNIYHTNFYRGDLHPSRILFFISWIILIWGLIWPIQFQNCCDQWWPVQALEIHWFHLFDWVYMTINNDLPLPDLYLGLFWQRPRANLPSQCRKTQWNKTFLKSSKFGNINLSFSGQ